MRFSVMSDLFGSLSKPEAVRDLVDIISKGDSDRFYKLLDSAGIDRLDDPRGVEPRCVSIADLVVKVFKLRDSPGYEPVWVLRENLSTYERFEFFRIEWETRREGFPTDFLLNATVWTSGQPIGVGPGTIRTIVPDGEFQSRLRAAGILERAWIVASGETRIEVDLPSGSTFDICFPPRI
jgi:hypothetical protein